MSLRHIMLGILGKPRSGYDIKQEFNDALRHFWAAELSQIYPQLNRMELDGLLISKSGPSKKGPNRRIYSRTSKGTDELLAWLTGGPRENANRITHLAQVFFLASVSDHAKTLKFFHELRENVAERLIFLQSVETRWKQQNPAYPDALSDEEFYPQLTLRAGMMRLETTLVWCDECIARTIERKTVNPTR